MFCLHFSSRFDNCHVTFANQEYIYKTPITYYVFAMSEQVSASEMKNKTLKKQRTRVKCHWNELHDFDMLV